MKHPKRPGGIILGMDRYVPAVFLIHSKRPDGTPALCTLIPDRHDYKVDLAGGEEFMTGYIPEIMVTPDTNKEN